MSGDSYYGDLATDPAEVTQATAENVPWAVDMTNALPSVGSVSAVTTSLVDLTLNGETVTLADAPVVAGNVVTQIVRGSVLTAGHSYRLQITYTAAANTVLTSLTVIYCPV